MNERFNELRLDAGIGRLNEVPYLVAVNKEGEIIDPLEGLQQFAELIVQECVEQLEISKRCDPYTGQLFNCVLNDNLDYAIVALKEHFGVEE